MGANTHKHSHFYVNKHTRIWIHIYTYTSIYACSSMNMYSCKTCMTSESANRRLLPFTSALPTFWRAHIEICIFMAARKLSIQNSTQCACVCMFRDAKILTFALGMSAWNFNGKGDGERRKGEWGKRRWWRWKYKDRNGKESPLEVPVEIDTTCTNRQHNWTKVPENWLTIVVSSKQMFGKVKQILRKSF